MRVLITGLTGFVGSHLAEYALAQGAEVYGSAKWRSKTENIDHLQNQINLIDCDLRDLSSVNVLIKESQPDVIFNLAAQSFVPHSWHEPGETLSNNIICQVNLFEAIRANGIDPSPMRLTRLNIARENTCISATAGHSLPFPHA